ncbi:MAG: glycosyltransferase family 61 protein [Candidatus Endonucleobacter bathymodioli]|uniref:Glycosyltransferase family 61 protein n=1 Tax=Candidatus Endonucleibacter bathymodioli TaxID=539814 RepID=A0AA90NVJ9_9GAMM|nr:glycosyltransferase family 61 protein [Candidatus Endonucleobacter bathymodioli]
MQMVAMWTSQKLLWVLLAFRLFFSVCKSRWRKLSLLSDYVATKGIEKHQIVGSQELHLLLKDAVVSPMSDRELLQEREEKTDFPEIYVAVLKLVTVSGRSNFLLVDGVVVCHDLFDCHRDKTSEELHKVVMISPERKLMRWLMHDESPVKVPVAAVFTDACAPNYAHWITEVLPRITVFCAQERYKDIPIVVNGDLHANIMDSLLLVAGPDRGIIILDEGRMIIVDVLYVTSVTGYVPFGRRGNELRGHSHGLFSPHALKAMQEYIKQDKRLVDAYTDWPEKIFLRRDRGARRVSNNDEVEQLVNAQGYRSVDVEKLTFLEQFQLFRNAKVVISPTGAALANAVFVGLEQRFCVYGKT